MNVMDFNLIVLLCLAFGCTKYSIMGYLQSSSFISIIIPLSSSGINLFLINDKPIAFSCSSTTFYVEAFKATFLASLCVNLEK